MGLLQSVNGMNVTLTWMAPGGGPVARTARGGVHRPLECMGAHSVLMM